MKINTDCSTEQHASWIASNPVVGCPKDCAYCFLKPEGLNCKAPEVLFSVSESLDDLQKSIFYQEDIPVATGTRTDYFSTPNNVEYLKEYVIEYNKRGIPNPLILITKCSVPQDFIDLLINLEEKGSTFIFFLSYSGLNADIEKGIDHEKLRENFRSLNSAGLKVIHYWRPFVPQNSSKEAMSKVIDHTVNYSKASVIAGLRLTPEMQKQFWFWGEVRDLDIDFSQIEGVWPEHVKGYLENYYSGKYPKHPIGYASSCAIANALQLPDYNGFYNTGICRSNSCPESQREICRKHWESISFDEGMVKKSLKRLGVKGVGFTWDKKRKVLILSRPLEHGKIVNLTQSHKVPVETSEIDDGYGWGSSVTERQPYYMKTDGKNEK